MTPIERLEDLSEDWQEKCQPTIEEHARHIATRIADQIAQAPSMTEGDSPLLRDIVREDAQTWAEQKLLPGCVAFLQERGHWPSEEVDLSRVRYELAAALHRLPTFSVESPRPTWALPIRSWAAAAGCGAALGMLVFAPAALLVLGQREVGLLAGGIMGSAALVALAGYLAQSPSIRKGLSYVLAASTAGAVFARIWQWRRGGRSAGWLRAAAGFGIAAFAAVLARPQAIKPNLQAYSQQLQRQLQLHLARVADLVLGWTWAHPDRMPAAPQSEQVSAQPLSSSVCDALADLSVQLASAGQSSADLIDCVEELLQRLEDDGYQWLTIDSGARFEEAMKEDFDTFGLIRPGDRVRTRRAATRYQDRLVYKGELRRS